MSSMIIPIGSGGAGASGGGSFIQVYADAPQYIEGKYLRVSLGGDEIYADSIPTNVDAITLQITEAGTYTIAVYASSSSATAEESHTVLVDSLTASPSVHLGTSILEEDNEQSYETYYYPSETAIKTGTEQSGTKTGKMSEVGLLVEETYTATYDGVVNFEFNFTGYEDSTSSNAYNTVSATVSDSNNNNLINGYPIGYAYGKGHSGYNNPQQKIIPLAVTAGTTYTIRIKIITSSGYTSNSYTIKYSNTYYRIKGTSTTKVIPKSAGIRAKAVKSIQTGRAASARYTMVGGSGWSTYTSGIIISEVNPEKTLLITSSTAVGDNPQLVYKHPEYPNMFLYDAYTTQWVAIEFY